MMSLKPNSEILGSEEANGAERADAARLEEDAENKTVRWAHREKQQIYGGER